MSIAPDLFTSIDPPGVWLTIHPLEPVYADERAVTLRIKPMGARSVTATVKVSRYSPETGILTACKVCLERLMSEQAPVTRVRLGILFAGAIADHVEPF